MQCKHCGRAIERDEDGRWVDPEATGDDSVWRETCDAHDTFIADHEPASYEAEIVITIHADSEEDALARAKDWAGYMTECTEDAILASHVAFVGEVG